MNPWTVAVLLVMLPIETPRVVEDETSPVYLQALKDVVDLLEILPRDDSTWTQTYPVEVRWAQLQLRLTSQRPPLADAHRLPSFEEAKAKVAFNEERGSWLTFGQRCDSYCRWGRWQQLINENYSAGVHWRTIEAAQDPGNHPSRRRMYLDELRWRLGPEAYYAGQWPPHVPLEMFQADP